MRFIAYREFLSPSQVGILKQQFPGYLVIQGELSSVQTQLLEVLCTNNLEVSELKSLTSLQWVHVPGGWSAKVCWDALLQREGLLLTVGPSDAAMLREWFLASILAHLQHLPSRRLLQIGLGGGTGEICRVARAEGMKTYAIHSHRTFHPHCDQVGSRTKLSEWLPEADCVVLATPFARHGQPWLGSEELRCMRPGSLLMLLAGGDRLDPALLQAMLNEQHLCGVVTNGRACVPESADEQFQSFLRNLRNYVAGDSDRMEGRVSSSTG